MALCRYVPGLRVVYLLALPILTGGRLNDNLLHGLAIGRKFVPIRDSDCLDFHGKKFLVISFAADARSNDGSGLTAKSNET